MALGRGSGVIDIALVFISVYQAVGAIKAISWLIYLCVFLLLASEDVFLPCYILK